MSRPDLTPVSYVVLGLVARDGPSTPYALKTAVGRGIAHFWPFPHSQIYAETGRLAGLGCWPRSASTPAGGGAATGSPRGPGRARRLAGRAGRGAPQFRSLGLLKLFFGQHAGPGDVAELATAQVELHRQVVVHRRDRRAAPGPSRPSRPARRGRADGRRLPGHGRALGAGRRDRRWLGRPGRRPGPLAAVSRPARRAGRGRPGRVAAGRER